MSDPIILIAVSLVNNDHGLMLAVVVLKSGQRTDDAIIPARHHFLPPSLVTARR